eukprot:1427635-Amphidinium_carterae.1
MAAAAIDTEMDLDAAAQPYIDLSVVSQRRAAACFAGTDETARLVTRVWILYSRNRKEHKFRHTVLDNQALTFGGVCEFQEGKTLESRNPGIK